MGAFSRPNSPIRKKSFFKSGFANFSNKPRSNHKQYSPSLSTGDSFENLPYLQREVFDWYEINNYRDDAGIIFSRDWQRRLTSWGENFDLNTRDLERTISSYEIRPEQLELGRFFQAHPVAAFSLWHVLQACYKLDKIICGTTIPERNKVAEWEKWRPFEYLLSDEIKSTWHNNLQLFSSEVKQSTDKIRREAVATRLDALAEGVQSLEESLSTLVAIFGAKEKEMPGSYWMLERVQEGVDIRCRAIVGVMDSPRLSSEGSSQQNEGYYAKHGGEFMETSSQLYSTSRA